MALRKEKLESIKSDLLARRNELSIEIQRGTAEMIDEDPFHADSVDQAAADTERDIAVHIKNHERSVLHAIDEALRRIETGIFGECQECGESISDARMKVNPSTTLCIGCKAELESEESRYGRA